MATAMGEIETRSILEGVDFRLTERAQQKMPTIEGFAAIFNDLGKPILDIPDYAERVLPGAFSTSLDGRNDVRALVEHDRTKVIGRQSAGTLELKETKRGLHVRIHPPDTMVGRDVVESVRRGDITGMSIGFLMVKGGSRFLFEGNMEIREFSEVDLREVSIVTWPAFDTTEVAVRSLDQHRRNQYALRVERNNEWIQQFASEKS